MCVIDVHSENKLWRCKRNACCGPEWGRVVLVRVEQKRSKQVFTISRGRQGATRDAPLAWQCLRIDHSRLVMRQNGTMAQKPVMHAQKMAALYV